MTLSISRNRIENEIQISILHRQGLLTCVGLLTHKDEGACHIIYAIPVFFSGLPKLGMLKKSTRCSEVLEVGVSWRADQSGSHALTLATIRLLAKLAYSRATTGH